MITPIQGVHLDGSAGSAVQRQQPLAIGRGESLRILLSVVGVDAAAVDLTGWGVAMRVCRRDGTTLVHRLGVLTSAIDGEATIDILTSETATWAAQVGYYIIWITNPSGESFPVILRSDFTVEDRAMDVDGEGSTPGPDMLLVGVPVPQAGDEGKALRIVSVDPLVFEWAI